MKHVRPVSRLVPGHVNIKELAVCPALHLVSDSLVTSAVRKIFPADTVVPVYVVKRAPKITVTHAAPMVMVG